MNARREVASLGVNPETLLQFFVDFARFEYALKAAGYFRARAVHRRRRKKAVEYPDAEADWGRFTESIRVTFRPDADSRLSGACGYLFENPPYREVIADGSLVWETRPPREDQAEVDRALCYVRWVRNNLFHGGKFSPAHGGPGRNAALIEHSLVVLGACLALFSRCQTGVRECRLTHAFSCGAQGAPQLMRRVSRIGGDTDDV